HPFVPDYIEKIGRKCALPSEDVFRIMYYDCAPFEGTVTLPVSGTPKKFTGGDAWLRELSKKDLFAVRLGVLKFRGFVPKKIQFRQQHRLETQISTQNSSKKAWT